MPDTPSTTATPAGSAAEPAKTTSESPAVAPHNDVPADGRTIAPLEVKMEASKSTTKNQSSVKPAEEDPHVKDLEKKDGKQEVPTVSSVAQLRDAGIASGSAPSTEQVEKMRDIEDKNLEELGKQHRLPDAQQTGKK